MLASIVGSPVSRTPAQQEAPPVQTTAVLEDWTTSGIWTLDANGIRKLRNVADRELWEVQTGSDTGNQSQSISVVDNTLQLVVGDGGPAAGGNGDEAAYIHFYPKDPNYLYPGGYTQNKLVDGTWSTNFNELRFQMKCDQSHLACTGSQRVGWHFGNYVRSHLESNGDIQGAHYYNAFNMEVTADEWIWVTIHQQPHAKVGESGSTIYAYQPNFFDNLTRFYLDEWEASPWTGANATWNFGSFVFQVQNDLPFVTQDSKQVLPVANVTVTHNGTGYDLGWQSQKYSTIVYSIYTHTSSIKESGIGAATLLGTTNSLSNSPYTMLRFRSGALSKANRYFAIKPDVTDEFTEAYYEVIS